MSYLERFAIVGESPDFSSPRSPVERASEIHESGCLGLQLQAGWYTSFKAASNRNIYSTGPTAHK